MSEPPPIPVIPTSNPVKRPASASSQVMAMRKTGNRRDGFRSRENP